MFLVHITSRFKKLLRNLHGISFYFIFRHIHIDSYVYKELYYYYENQSVYYIALQYMIQYFWEKKGTCLIHVLKTLEHHTNQKAVQMYNTSQLLNDISPRINSFKLNVTKTLMLNTWIPTCYEEAYLIWHADCHPGFYCLSTGLEKWETFFGRVSGRYQILFCCFFWSYPKYHIVDWGWCVLQVG